ncbi:hypothetical protein AK812_SmicGene46684, partial [Symbiodinium microadriaticum]
MAGCTPLRANLTSETGSKEGCQAYGLRPIAYCLLCLKVAPTEGSPWPKELTAALG